MLFVMFPKVVMFDVCKAIHLESDLANEAEQPQNVIELPSVSAKY